MPRDTYIYIYVYIYIYIGSITARPMLAGRQRRLTGHKYLHNKLSHRDVSSCRFFLWRKGLSPLHTVGVINASGNGRCGWEGVRVHIGPHLAERVGLAPPGGVGVGVWFSSRLYCPFDKGSGQHIIWCLKNKKRENKHALNPHTPWQRIQKSLGCTPLFPSPKSVCLWGVHRHRTGWRLIGVPFRYTQASNGLGCIVLTWYLWHIQIWWQYLVPTYRFYTVPRYATIPKLTCWHVVSVLLNIWSSAPRYTTRHDTHLDLTRWRVCFVKYMIIRQCFPRLWYDTYTFHARGLGLCLF